MMNLFQVKNVIQSTVNVAVLKPVTHQPIAFGSGCVIKFNGKVILLTVAHVTTAQGGTCIELGLTPVGSTTPFFSVGPMNYLAKFDIATFNGQFPDLTKPIVPDAKKGFGLLDFSYASVPEHLKIHQRRMYVSGIRIKRGFKKTISTTLTDLPDSNETYGFTGRVNPQPFKQFVQFSHVFHSGLRFVNQYGNFHKFELRYPISYDYHFKGTSGAPIVDSKGKLVALVSYGYVGQKYLYGVALSQVRAGIEAAILAGSI
jgi:hypothetical protein